jgi:hypothetical protein
MKYLFAFLSILALTAMACGFTVNIPDRPTPGPLVTDQISIESPESDQARLKIQFGAGELKLSPGADDTLVEGTATYNVPNFKPIVVENGDEIVIKQDEFKSINVTDIKNEWDLKLGDTPMELEINAGAYEGRFDLGGLALTGLVIKDGASDVELDFSAPNQTEMSVFRYETGASAVGMTGLANANFSTMFFNGGAGDYRLDFSGDLQQDGTVRVETGFADLTLVIPEDVSARVTVEGAAINVNPGSGWGQSGQTYTQDGSGPSLTIIVKMTAGNVTIMN